MNIAVAKFGGTSVATPEARERAAQHIERLLYEGYAVVVVVSAMGRIGSPYATDTLLSLLREENSDLQVRDMLMSCGETISACVFADMLMQRGLQAAPMTGAQAGIITDDVFGSATILGIDIAHIVQRLSQGEVVVITGFQGQTVASQTTTLGRGGSDISAVVIGGFLGAQRVDIYTDVDGIALVDPRIVPNARFLPQIGYEDMLQLATYGAGVIHPRAVEAARDYGVETWVRSTFSDLPGTKLCEQSGIGLAGIALLKNCKMGHRLKGALPVDDKDTIFALPGAGEQSVVTLIYHPLCDVWHKIEFELMKEREIYRNDDVLRIVLPNDEAKNAVRQLYEMFQ